MNYNLEERLKLAEKLHESGYNCAQTVACSFCDHYDIDESLLLKVTESFGGGMAMQSICGAMTGMLVLAGLDQADGNNEKPSTKKNTYKLARMLEKEFEDINGTLMCKDLKSGKGPKGKVSCLTCMLTAVEIYHNYLNEEKQVQVEV